MDLIVKISDYRVSTNEEDELVTHSLATCVGVAIVDPHQGIAALGHFLLPESKTSPEKAKTQPAAFCDTGLYLMLKEMFDLGIRKRGLKAYLVGGSDPLTDTDVFQISKRNILVAKRMLWKNNIFLAAEETGGAPNRTVRVRVKDGRVKVKDNQGIHEL